MYTLLYSFVPRNARIFPDGTHVLAAVSLSSMDQGEEQQQRRVPRYPFSAPAAVIPESGTPIGANVTELSLFGCYLDSTAPLASKTRVLVKIFAAAGAYFEADATVIYANRNLGMGLVFRQVKPHYQALLKKWLLAAMQEAQSEKKDPEDNQDPEPTGGD
ncbi:MAG: PilZ domain-containing protein [Candidatus Acidiferrum sp.]|jgi:PilZ domain-containing protein